MGKKKRTVAPPKTAAPPTPAPAAPVPQAAPVQMYTAVPVTTAAPVYHVAAAPTYQPIAANRAFQPAFQPVATAVPTYQPVTTAIPTYQPVTTGAAQAMQVFDSLDRDGDGVLTRSELQAALR